MPSVNNKKSRLDSAFTAFLALMADSRWVSKRALYLLHKEVSRRSEVIGKLQDDGLRVCIKMNFKTRETEE